MASVALIAADIALRRERAMMRENPIPPETRVQFFATAKLSAAGHIVMSKEAREHMKLHKDTKFLVLGGGAFVILTAMPPDAIRQLDVWARAARSWMTRMGRNGQGVAKRAAAAAGVRVRRKPAKASGARTRSRPTAH